LKAKTVALVVLGVISLVSPLLEKLLTGSVETFSHYDIAEAFLSGLLIYCWYYEDKFERGYRSGRLMNVGVILLAVAALPIYFIRSRGWRSGALTIVLALLVTGACSLLGYAGEWLGGHWR
jgi:hypothetical protein